MGKYFPSVVEFASSCILEMIDGQSREITEDIVTNWEAISIMKTGAIVAFACAVGPFLANRNSCDTKVVK